MKATLDRPPAAAPPPDPAAPPEPVPDPESEPAPVDPEFLAWLEELL